MILSVDIGHQYLAYAFYNTEDKSITYGIYHFEGTTSCLSRCENIVAFLKAFPSIYLIIEQQIGLNVKAIELQYALTATALELGIQVEIQHATTKFLVLEEPYTTVGKAHKALSSRLALEWLTTVQDCSQTPLSDYQKQDDIADAINMLRAYLISSGTEKECRSTSSDPTTQTT
jgi:hypothetical protein